MSPLHKSTAVDTLIIQSNIGMGSISKIMVKEEGKTEVGSLINSNKKKKKITAFEVGGGVKVYNIEPGFVSVSRKFGVNY